MPGPEEEGLTVPKTISTARGTFVFAATIVGAGILALPVVASEAGFLPLATMIIALAGVSVLSGLYIAESVLADKEGSHLPALARQWLGPWGSAAMLIGIAIYVYGALIGYLAAGGQVFYSLSHGAIPVWLGTLIYFVIGTAILHGGIVLISRVNTYLMWAMLVLLGVVMGMAVPHIQVHLMQRTGWSSILDVFGVVLFSFLGHSVLPSIASSLEDKRQIAKVIAAGLAVPCVLYLLWSLVVLGAVPVSSELRHSLSGARTAGHPATIPLGFVVGGSVILLGNAFAALSTLTSYTGLGVSLKDSYQDVATYRRRSVPGWALTALVALPPLVVALLKPDAFVRTLDIAGTFGGGLFVGILPVLIVLRMRRREASQEFRTPGGNALALIVMTVYVAGMLYTLVSRFIG
jgi:tyrosine-specific transport protein